MAEWLGSHGLYAVIDAVKAAGIRELIFGGGDKLTPMEPEIAERLREYFQPDFEALEKILERDLSRWKAGDSRARKQRRASSRDAQATLQNN